MRNNSAQLGWLLITPHFIARDIIDIVRLINRRKLNGTAQRGISLLTSLQKYASIGRQHRTHRTHARASAAYVVMHLRHNAEKNPRLIHREE